MHLGFGSIIPGEHLQPVSAIVSELVERLSLITSTAITYRRSTNYKLY